MFTYVYISFFGVFQHVWHVKILVYATSLLISHLNEFIFHLILLILHTMHIVKLVFVKIYITISCVI